MSSSNGAPRRDTPGPLHHLEHAQMALSDRVLELESEVQQLKERFRRVPAAHRTVELALAFGLGAGLAMLVVLAIWVWGR